MGLLQAPQIGHVSRRCAINTSASCCNANALHTVTSGACALGNPYLCGSIQSETRPPFKKKKEKRATVNLQPICTCLLFCPVTAYTLGIPDDGSGLLGPSDSQRTGSNLRRRCGMEEKIGKKESKTGHVFQRKCFAYPRVYVGHAKLRVIFWLGFYFLELHTHI